MYTHEYIYACIHTNRCTHIDTHAYMHTHAHTYIYKYTYMHIYTQACTHRHTHTPHRTAAGQSLRQDAFLGAASFLMRGCGHWKNLFRGYFLAQ